MTTIIEYPPGPSYKMRPAKLVREFLHDPIKTLQEISYKYGEISHFQLGRQHVYLINNPDYIEKVLVYDHRNFTKGKRLQLAKALLGEGLVTSEGDLHNRQRRIIQPLFHPKQITTYSKVITNYAARLNHKWKDGETLDILKEMMQMTLSIICKSVLNYEVESEAEEVGRALTTCRNYSKRLQSPLGQVLNRIPILPNVKGARKSKEKLDRLVYGLIKERRQRPESSAKSYDDLLARLLQAQDSAESSPDTGDKSKNGPASGMSDTQVRDEIMTIFIAGHETTANALTWTFYLLSQHPGVEEKLLAELKAVIDSNGVATVNDIPKLKFTERVVRESMRLYPPVWAMGRSVGDDYPLGGYTIPAGSTIMMSQYVMHRDPRYYNEPDRYDPDRWDSESRSALPRFSYFPFGGGIRACVGEPFAWMEAILVLATIGRQWKMRLVPGHRVELDPAITLRPKYGMKMKLERRNV
ncbi:MAG TPA: cytochrome P450 [Candidatus Nitrosopolaris sp.]|nr:cytochrome P450 [Candidatus Nitrosopolaris sp.]